MRRSALLLVLSFFATSILTDDASAQHKKRRKKRKQHRTHQPAAGLSGSAKARAQNSFGAGVLVTPLSDFVLQYGVGGYYNHGASWQFGAALLTGSEDISGEVSDIGTVTLKKADLSGSATFAYGRYFFGNSFNGSAGLGYRTAKADYRIEDTASDDYVEGTLDISSVVTTLAIGNHWSWNSGFTIGVDWLAAMVPLSGSASSSTKSNADGVQVEKLNQEFLDVGDELSQNTSLTLALTTIGYQF